MAAVCHFVLFCVTVPIFVKIGQPLLKYSDFCDFPDGKILTVIPLKEANMHHRTKFHRNWLRLWRPSAILDLLEQ